MIRYKPRFVYLSFVLDSSVAVSKVLTSVFFGLMREQMN